MANFSGVITISLCLLFAMQARAATAGTLPLSCSPLPEPDQVNEALARSFPEWKNPLLGEQAHPLRVIKCRSFGRSNQSEESFDFYQVEVPTQPCQLPPAEAITVHHRQLAFSGRWFFHPWTIAMWLGLVAEGVLALGVICVVVDSVIYASGYAFYWVWLQLIEGIAQVPEERLEDVECPGEQPDAQATETLEQNPKFQFDKPSEDAAPRALRFDKWLRESFWYVVPEATPSFLKIVSATTAARLRTWLANTVFFVFALLLMLASATCAVSILNVLLFSADYTPDAMKCIWPETWVEHHGPVRLPDPNQGINQYLSSSPLAGPATEPLQLCTKRSLQFYAACSGSCAHLGDPYVGLVPASEPTVVDSCPNIGYRFLAWLAMAIGSVGFVLVCALLAICFCGCCALCCMPADLRTIPATPEVELEQLKEGDAKRNKCREARKAPNKQGLEHVIGGNV